MGDSVKWTWIAPELVKGMAYRVTQTETPSSEEDHPDGFSSGTQNTESGELLALLWNNRFYLLMIRIRKYMNTAFLHRILLRTQIISELKVPNISFLHL